MTTAELAAQYKTDGMLAYVKLIQEKERELKCDVLTHQKWYVHRPYAAYTLIAHYPIVIQERSELH